MTERLINGVPASRYGVWCAHGKHIMIADLADVSEYPATVMADPWPCGDCTPEQFEAEMAEEAEAFERERWEEYHAEIRASLSWDHSLRPSGCEDEW